MKWHTQVHYHTTANYAGSLTMKKINVVLTYGLTHIEAGGDFTYSANLTKEVPRGTVEAFWFCLNNMGAVFALEHDPSEFDIDISVDITSYDLIKANYMWYDGTDQYTGINSSTTWTSNTQTTSAPWTWANKSQRTPWISPIGGTTNPDTTTWYGEDPPKQIFNRVMVPIKDELPGMWGKFNVFRVKSS